MSDFDLSVHGLTVRKVLRNVDPSQLYEEAIRYEPGTTISNTGALIAYSGDKTGRSPKDKRVVRNAGFRKGHLVGPGQRSRGRGTLSRSTASAPTITSTLASGFIASTALPAGIRAIASRSASSARVRITRCSCTQC